MSMIQNYNITPRMERYACIVDLLGRAGHLNEAQDFFLYLELDKLEVMYYYDMETILYYWMTL